MEKSIAETAGGFQNAHQSADLDFAPEKASAEAPAPGQKKVRREKVRGDHSLNVNISYELKGRLAALSEKYELVLADVVRQVLKAGLPVFESLTAAQEELVSGFVQLRRRGRGMGELKK